MMKQGYVEHNCLVNNCAVNGATSFFLSIENSVVVINGSKFCFTQMLHSIERAFSGDFKERAFCTDIAEDNIVFGTEDKLCKLLVDIKNTKNPDIIFIQNNCAVSLIGDDIKNIANSLGFSCPIVCLDSGGIQGDFYDGYILAAKEFFKTLKLPLISSDEQKYINIIGVSESYYNFINDKNELSRLLALGNIKILNYVAYNMNVKKIINMRKAQLNVVIHKELGEEIAELLYQKYGIPYIVLLPPYGLRGSERWLQKILKAINAKKKEIENVAAIFKKYHRQFELSLQKATKIYGELWIDRIIIAGTYSTVMGIANALRTEILNYHYMDLYIYSSCEIENVDKRYYNFSKEFSGFNLKKNNDSSESCFIFSSANEHALLLLNNCKKSYGYCCINHPGYDYITLGPYMGIEGCKKILEQIWQYYISKSN